MLAIEKPRSGSGAFDISVELKTQCPSYLNQPWGGVPTQTRSKNASWHTDGINDRAESRTAYITIRLIEIRVVQDVEKLQAYADSACFIDRDVEVLHDCQVGVKVLGSPDLIAPLHAPTIYGGRELSCGVQARRIESVTGTDYWPTGEIIGKDVVPEAGSVVEEV
jgi:hypothetical protein